MRNILQLYTINYHSQYTVICLYHGDSQQYHHWDETRKMAEASVWGEDLRPFLSTWRCRCPIKTIWMSNKPLSRRVWSMRERLQLWRRSMWASLVLEEKMFENWSQGNPTVSEKADQETAARKAEKDRAGYWKGKPVCPSMKNVSPGRETEWSVVSNAADSSNKEGWVLTTAYGKEGHWWHSQE